MNSLSQVYKNNPINPRHIIPIDFDSIQNVPDTHVWNKIEEPELLDDDCRLIPLVDMKDPDAASLIGNAFETWGMVQVRNHGISFDLLEKVESEAKRLFSLPYEDKLKALRSPGDTVGYGRPRISQFYDKCMWHEGFSIMGNSAVKHAQKLWPHDYQRFCDIMEDYQKKMRELSTILMRLILKYLNIPEEKMNTTLLSPGGENINPALQLNSYPACPDPTKTMGLAPHTDTSIFTIVHISNKRGLQIFNQNSGGWVEVHPISSDLLVNVGDILHLLSNGKFLNVLHRVVLKEAIGHRLSVAYFHIPVADFHICPNLSLKVGETPMYRSLSVKEYFGYKVKNSREALSFVRI